MDRRLDIEERYQNKIEKIHAKFSIDLQEAKNHSDVLAFLKIKQDLDLELAKAQEWRDLAIEKLYHDRNSHAAVC